MDRKPRILFVDDEQLLHNLFERLFARHGMEVVSCSNALQAMDLLREQTFDLVVTDFMMPDMDGLELLAHIRQEYPSTRVIMITAHANVQHAVRTMQHGAIDYIPKPFTTADLVDRVKASLAKPLPEEAPARKPRPKASGGRTKAKEVVYIGESPAIKRLKEMLPRVARNRAPVFIQGESGTGKEVLARLIHLSSDRTEGPYVTINCANLPRELVESHLFGHRKGAFTGAIEDMTGAFERADGGTLLLDEITEIELPVQAKLLRVLQEREFQKVGSTEPQKVDVRIIATSNRDLGEAIAQGIFREDLYHRLAVFPLTVPPLRERIGDVPLLARHFVEKYCRIYEMPLKSISKELMSRFKAYNWPGNVRQLENMVHRGVVLSGDEEVIDVPHVFDEFFSEAEASGSGRPIDTLQTIEDMERYMILQTLSETGNNQQIAAERLGISARTIRNKLRKYREEGYID
ncbi:MAG: sigma-54-dependent Fis family transcriptional regulator [Rhodothermaceae bacterium]|nr:MAG: sigma-54-dependent Fis family transcriptional regulator [Rhodothermaceae bacterium]